VRPPITSTPDAAELLAAAARVRECGAATRHQSAALRWRMDERGLSGPAGEALAGLGGSVAGQLAALADRCTAAADALVRAAHRAAVDQARR